uniref:Uncharacterized protein n=1 Tax=Quercus lobata TaxID=97700 RepID=A0A7N2QXT8_QUELO
MGPSSAISVAEGKGSNSVLMMTFRVISPNRKSTKTTKNKGKATITAIKYSAPDRAILFSFYNCPQPLWVWADGTSIISTKLNLHVYVREREKASIKGGRSSPERRLGRGPRTGATQAMPRRKSSWISLVHLCAIIMNTMTYDCPFTKAQSFSPLSTNSLYWARWSKIPPTMWLFNCAALKTEGDTRSDGSMAKPWRLCTVQQIEGLKTLIRIFPMVNWHIFKYSSSNPRELDNPPSSNHGPSSWATFQNSNWSLTPLERVGVGHILNILSMIVSAIVDSKRLKIAHHLKHQPDSTVPMLVFWLFPPLALGGIAEEFHFPGQIAFYYQEFPVSLRSTAIAIASVTIGIAYYLSTAMVDLVKRVTGWLPDDINNGRPDNVYWMQAVVGVLNFGYYLVCT